MRWIWVIAPHVEWLWFLNRLGWGFRLVGCCPQHLCRAVVAMGQGEAVLRVVGNAWRPLAVPLGRKQMSVTSMFVEEAEEAPTVSQFHSTELDPPKVNTEKLCCNPAHYGTSCEFLSMPQFLQGLWEEPG